MTTQPDLPDPAAPPAPPLRLASPSATPAPDVDFDAFVRRYETRLRRLVVRRIGDPSEAEEITQETLLRAYQHRQSFASEDELMAWSTVVAQRLVIDRVRVRGRSVAVPEVPENARLGRDTADIVVARHEARAALEALEAIPTRQAAILWAREVEGLHYDDIAARFGITEPAVRSLLHRGRRALRREFQDRTGTVPLNGLVPFAPWLLALKAAGRVRDAAKTAVNPLTATAITVAFVTAISVTSPVERMRPPATQALPRTTALGPGAAGGHVAGPELDIRRSGDAIAAPSGPAGDRSVRSGSGGEKRSGVAVRPPDPPCALRTCVEYNVETKVPTLWIEVLPKESGYQYVRVVASPVLTSCEDVPDAPRVKCTEHSGEYPDEQDQSDGSEQLRQVESVGGKR